MPKSANTPVSTRCSPMFMPDRFHSEASSFEDLRKGIKNG